MASFTDMIPTFNPYIQQLPVEEMMTVGMEKQRRYDEGIQKIQSQIDNIAGLDVARDVDRKYLQSKLNQVGNELRTVAAGDFSNFQLVNSTGGMINQVAKDRNIVNAVRSTAKYKKAIENRDKYRQEGKGSPSNDWLFGKQVNDWMNSEDLEEQFNGDYLPYVDWKANAREALKSINPNAVITDDAFDENGRLTDAVIREQFKGVRPERIQQALMASLTPADFQQMQIDGRYKYSNYQPEQFANEVNKSYSEKFADISKKRTELIGKKNSSGDSREKENLQSMIDNLDKHLSTTQKEYDNIAQTFEAGDAESAKARLFTTNFMTNFSNAFAYSEVSKTYENNPLAQMALNREQFAATHNQRERFHAEKMQYEGAKLRLKQEELDLMRPTGGIAVGLEQPKITESSVLSKIDNDKKTIDQRKIDALALTFSNDELLAYRKHLAGDGLSLKESEIVASMNQTLFDLEDAYNKGELKDPMLVPIFDNLNKVQREMDADMAAYERVKNKVDSEHPAIEELIPEDSRPVTFVSPETGVQYVYTPAEIVNFNERLKDFVVDIGGRGGGAMGAGALQYKDEEAKRQLSPKEYALYQTHKKARGGIVYMDRDTGEHALAKSMQEFREKVNAPYQEVIKARREDLNEGLNKVNTGYQPIGHPIPLANAAQKSQLGNTLLTLSTIADEPGAMPEGVNSSSEEIQAIAANPKAAQITVQEGNFYQPETYRLTVTGGNKGELTTAFNLSRENYERMFQGKLDPSPTEQIFRPIENQLNRNSDMPVRTTSIDGSASTTYQNSFLQKTDFPKVEIYGIRGNVVESPTSPGRYSINALMYNPETEKWTSPSTISEGLLTSDQVATFMNIINDYWLYEKLNGGEKATPEILKRLKDKK